ncbi:hypothetical protein [Sphingomonas sp. ERG5]|uniref:hypothetical protein n=1 Tax=Sphingomonas sp. ERG5 TaxID=1381597 RepID=UPI00054BFDF6|nr:hypothetical protein [Sphingomonas sp. ERG5]
MNRYWGSAVLATAISVTGGMAEAKEPAKPASPWAGCGENQVSGTTKFMMGPTAARALTPRTVPSVGIERCTAALDALDPQAGWERRAALLRSRAKFRVAAKQHREALADLDAIAAIERPDTAYTRSFGVSLHMLRAIAYLEAGRRDDAADEAVRAMQARPWNARIAGLAFSLSGLRTTIPPREKARWDNLVRLDGDYIERRAVALARAGEWTEALTDWQNAPLVPGGIGQTFINLPNVRVIGMPGIAVTGVNAGRTAQAVITAAMAGRSDLAELWLAEARKNIAAPREPTAMERSFKINDSSTEQRAALDTWSPLIEAAVLLGKGDAEGAATRLEGMKAMPVGQITLALIHAATARLPADSRPGLRVVLAQMEEDYRLNGNERFAAGFDPAPLMDGMPDHEEVMLANPYRSAVKFLRANGFSVKLAKDGKSAVVSFFGNKSHPFALGEMALLRAADLTVEQGKPAFRVTNNDEYTQTSTMTLNGTAIGPSTVSGHSVNLTVAFVDAGASERPEGIIQASEVQAALAPIYVKAEVK